MRRKLDLLSLVGFAGACLIGSPALAQTNVPLCFAIAQNYNTCVRQHQRQGWGWNGGYGGHGGYYADDDSYADYYRYHYRQRRAARVQAACAPWLLEMKANNCI